jgi:hypothetical protein
VQIAAASPEAANEVKNRLQTVFTNNELVGYLVAAGVPATSASGLEAVVTVAYLPPSATVSTRTLRCSLHATLKRYADVLGGAACKWPALRWPSAFLCDLSMYLTCPNALLLAPCSLALLSLSPLAQNSAGPDYGDDDKKKKLALGLGLGLGLGIPLLILIIVIVVMMMKKKKSDQTVQPQEYQQAEQQPPQQQ